jgi:predicted dehydrogenase
VKTLVIGGGSIGMRHAGILKDMGCDVFLVTKHHYGKWEAFSTIQEACSRENFDYVVIANQTCEHYCSLKQLASLNFGGQVLVEKPLFDRFLEFPDHSFASLNVGYNLRFHPALVHIRERLHEEKILSCHAYVGQYLPDWRPQRDYRECYSARKNRGGGVLRDLSHELDYLLWIFGDWRRLTAIGGKISDLEIDSEDTVAVLMETERCPVVSLQMNYLDRISKRHLIVNTTRMTFNVDLIEGNVCANDQVHHFYLECNEMYQKQHEAILSNDTEKLCTFVQGGHILRMITAIENSFGSFQGAWEQNHH